MSSLFKMEKEKLKYKLDELYAMEQRGINAEVFIQENINFYLRHYGEDEWIKDFIFDYQNFKQEQEF